MRIAFGRDGETERCAGPVMEAVEHALWRMVVLAETQLWQTLRASVVDGR
jgi:hypothetical protein